MCERKQTLFSTALECLKYRHCVMQKISLKNCEYSICCTNCLVEASTVYPEDVKNDDVEIIQSVAVRESISVHAKCDIAFDAL